MRHTWVMAAAIALLASALPTTADHDGLKLITSTDFDEEHPPLVGVPAEVNYYFLDAGEVNGHADSVLSVMHGDVPFVDIPHTHEHDAIANAFLAPGRDGPFRVHVEVPKASHEEAAGDDATYGEGAEAELVADVAAEARALVAATEAKLTMEGAMKAFNPSTLTFHLADAADQPLTGYVLVQLLADDSGAIAHQVKLSAAQGVATTTFLGAPFPLQVHAVAWPSLYTGPLWAPVTLDAPLATSPPDPAAVQPMPQLPEEPPVADPTGLLPPPSAQDHHAAHLFLSTDPAPQAWTNQNTRVNILAMNKDMLPIRHVDLTVKISDQSGLVWFQSESLHEVDGIGQVDFVYPLPGWYRIQATAKAISGEALEAERWFSVRALSEPGAGSADAIAAYPKAQLPESVEVEAPANLQVGSPAPFTFSLRYRDGTSIPHADYWMQLAEEGVPQVQIKLHTHEGDANPSIAVAKAGAYELRVAAYPQSGAAAAGNAGTFAKMLTLSADGALPEVPLTQTTAQSSPQNSTPGFEAAGLLIVGLAATLARRKR